MFVEKSCNPQRQRPSSSLQWPSADASTSPVPGTVFLITLGSRPNTDDHWTALGGVWEVVDGSMRNDSNDRGAKLLTGSPNWKDYVVEGDVQLLGIGSVGLLARVREAELGENSLKSVFRRRTHR